jgi:hypothetical protein
VPASDEVLAFTSLSRALRGNATSNDVGALLWMMIRQVVPCQAMVLFVPDKATDSLATGYVSGVSPHASLGLRSALFLNEDIGELDGLAVVPQLNGLTARHAG